MQSAIAVKKVEEETQPYEQSLASYPASVAAAIKDTTRAAVESKVNALKQSAALPSAALPPAPAVVPASVTASVPTPAPAAINTASAVFNAATSTAASPVTDPVTDPVTNSVIESVIENSPVTSYTSEAVCATCGCNPFGRKVAVTCPHCGCDPFSDPSQLEVSVEDKRRFLIAVSSGRPFQKVYRVFHNTIEIQFRSLTSREYNETAAWAALYALEKQPNISFTDRSVLVQQYEIQARMVLQVVRVQGLLKDSPLFWAVPEGTLGHLKDWQTAYPEDIQNYLDLYAQFTDVIAVEPLMAAILDQLGRFNELEYRLMREANNTQNFWDGI
jgi:hypothetical protein